MPQFKLYMKHGGGNLTYVNVKVQRLSIHFPFLSILCVPATSNNCQHRVRGRKVLWNFIIENSTRNLFLLSASISLFHNTLSSRTFLPVFRGKGELLELEGWRMMNSKITGFSNPPFFRTSCSPQREKFLARRSSSLRRAAKCRLLLLASRGAPHPARGWMLITNVSVRFLSPIESLPQPPFQGKNYAPLAKAWKVKLFLLSQFSALSRCIQA